MLKIITKGLGVLNVPGLVPLKKQFFMWMGHCHYFHENFSVYFCLVLYLLHFFVFTP
jgi:hypothetical protein